MGYALDDASIVAHVFFGTLGFGVAIAFDLLLVAISRTRNIDAIRQTYEAVRGYGRIIGLSFLVAIVVGFYLAAERHVPLASKWLLISYGWLVITGSVYGGLVQRRNGAILKAIQASNGKMTSELERLLGSASPAGTIVMVIAMAAIIGVMIVKPA